MVALRSVDPASAEYQEFARLYRLATALRPPVNGRAWNGVPLARSDRLWGSANLSTGVITLNEHGVLRHLAGRHSLIDPGEQVQALQTVLHETYHLRVPNDATGDPNAHRGIASMRSTRV